MAAAPFDTLKNAGFTDKQAEAIVFAIQTSIKGKALTKSDVLLMETDMQTALAEFRADFYRALWIQGTCIAIATATLWGIVVAIEKWLS